MRAFMTISAALALTLAGAPAVAQPSPQPPSDQAGGALIDEGGSGRIDNGHPDEGGTAPADLPLEHAKPQSEAEIRALLENQGYTDIRDIRIDGEVITASATRNGERREVVIRTKTESQDGG